MILMDLNYKVKLKSITYPFTKNNIIFVIKYISLLDDSIALFFRKKDSKAIAIGIINTPIYLLIEESISP